MSFVKLVRGRRNIGYISFWSIQNFWHESAASCAVQMAQWQ